MVSYLRPVSDALAVVRDSKTEQQWLMKFIDVFQNGDYQMELYKFKHNLDAQITMLIAERRAIPLTHYDKSLHESVWKRKTRSITVLKLMRRTSLYILLGLKGERSLSFYLWLKTLTFFSKFIIKRT